MSKFPCPRCGVDRKSLEADCVECGWKVATPSNTERPLSEQMPRQMSAFEHRALWVIGLVGFLVGFLIGGVFVGPLVCAWGVTATVLIIETAAMFRSADRRPKFSLRSMFIFTTAWAVFFLAMRLSSMEHMQAVYTLSFVELKGVAARVTHALLWVFVLVGIVSVPSCFSYIALGALRYRPAPIFAFVYLAGAISFLSLLVVCLLCARFEIQPTLLTRPLLICPLILLFSAGAFFVECRLNRQLSAHNKRSVAAIFASTQVYFAYALVITALQSFSI